MPALGLTGYQDWQRTSQVDTPALAHVVSGAMPLSTTLPAAGTYDVSRFANTSFYIQPNNCAAMLMTMTWFLDPAGTVLVGARQFVIPRTDTAIADPTALEVPNVGPYLKVSVKDITNIIGWGLDMVVWATNRQTAGASTPIRPQLAGNGTVVNIAGGSSIDVVIPGLWQGEAAVNLDTGGGGAGAYNLLAQNTLNGTMIVGSASFTNFYTQILAIPLLPLTLRLFNQSAGLQQWHYALTPGVGAT